MSNPNLNRATFLALIALQDGPKHGYEISTFIKERSSDFFSLPFGSLYPTLHKLEQDHLVEADWEAVGSAKRKKVYRLSEQGKRALAGELEHQRAFFGALSALLGEGR